jgi:hypothetical protein
MRPAMALLAGALALTGCGALNPYPTLPHPTTAGQPAGTRVAICYNGLKTSQEAAREAAQQECPAGTTAEPLDSDYILQYCPLLLPLRETFVCTQKAK